MINSGSFIKYLYRGATFYPFLWILIALTTLVSSFNSNKASVYSEYSDVKMKENKNIVAS